MLFGHRKRTLGFLSSFKGGNETHGFRVEKEDGPASTVLLSSIFDGRFTIFVSAYCFVDRAILYLICFAPPPCFASGSGFPLRRGKMNSGDSRKKKGDGPATNYGKNSCIQFCFLLFNPLLNNSAHIIYIIKNFSIPEAQNGKPIIL